VRFKVKHEVPLFQRLFSQVAKEFLDFQKERADAGQITHHRWRVMDSHVRSQLNPYIGNNQITLIGQDRWDKYPVWRQKNGKGRSGGFVSTGTIRAEMATFRSIMVHAATKQYIRESQVFRGKLTIAKAQREEFTPEEYRALHTFARTWIKKARNELGVWYRTIAYNFMLIMTNTGMRPSEARNLLWRDVNVHTDKEGRKFVRLSVRGKGKHRNLVAASSVATYFERVRELSKAPKPDDHVFTTEKGEIARTLYHSLIERLLTDSKLMHSASGSRRSTYCFRHTYATFRLTEGVDVYFLAKQMGTSVQMIEQHYGHISPVKNLERILQGMPGWEPADAAPDRTAGAPDLKKKKPSKDKHAPH
jgi:integrase